jgi:hypothetical protein
MVFYFEDEGRRFLQNLGNNQSEHMASQPSLYTYSFIANKNLLQALIITYISTDITRPCTAQKLIFNSHGHNVIPLHSTGRLDLLGVHALKLPKPKISAPC